MDDRVRRYVQLLAGSASRYRCLYPSVRTGGSRGSYRHSRMSAVSPMCGFLETVNILILQGPCSGLDWMSHRTSDARETFIQIIARIELRYIHRSLIDPSTRMRRLITGGLNPLQFVFSGENYGIGERRYDLEVQDQRFQRKSRKEVFFGCFQEQTSTPRLKVFLKQQFGIHAAHDLWYFKAFLRRSRCAVRWFQGVSPLQRDQGAPVASG